MSFRFSPAGIAAAADILGISDEANFELALQALAGDVDRQQRTGKRRWHHHKRGSNYTEIMRGFLNVATKPPADGDVVVIYIADVDNRVCVREAGEFEDGRFAELPGVKET